MRILAFNADRPEAQLFLPTPRSERDSARRLWGDGPLTSEAWELLGRQDFGQVPPFDSPFENVVGSRDDDLIEIDPLSVIRSIDGNCRKRLSGTTGSSPVRPAISV